MFSDELNTLGRKHVPSFIGVFACNELKNMIHHNRQTPYSFIVNTQTNNLPGEHWIAVSCENNGVTLIFDPLGFYYPPPLIHYLVAKKFRKIYFNRIQYQHPNSRICGQLCLEFLISLKGLSLAQKVSLMR